MSDNIEFEISDLDMNRCKDEQQAFRLLCNEGAPVQEREINGGTSTFIVNRGWKVEKHRNFAKATTIFVFKEVMS